MIPELWNELGTEKIGDLNDCLECFVEEERNGIFELTLDYPNGYPLADQLLKERIIVVNANDTFLNQKFRIYDTKKFINETITVFARHISFDLMYDYVNDVTFENQSCEYALNSLFRQSQFSTHYRGHSDIVNAQNYSMSMCNILEAIGGKEGSIIDTFGTGAEILRDNTDIHVLNARGHDNDVTIEYGKNLTGFELTEDTTDLVTRILPYAKYTPEGGKETIVKGNFVDSPLINNYSHPYIKHIDYSDKFQDKKDTPTKEKLETFANNEYRDNKVDIPKTNFKIEFIPLSKCVGYEELEDKISICDKVTIKNTRYNVDTKAKVIKYKFDVLKDRYESMELGEPRTTLGDVIGSGNGEGQIGPPGPQGPPGADGNIGDFPNSLPQAPILTSKVYGFASIELSWTYEDKVYYTYELYASKTKDFTPNTFDLIHSGQSSSYLFQAKPNETWYFRVCAKNTHGERTEFSPQVAVNTVREDSLSNYFTDIAIGKAVVGSLTADYMEAGIIKGNWIDMRHLTLTDGNGKRVIDIDDFGRAYMDIHELKINSSSAATNDYVSSKVNDGVSQSKTYTDTRIKVIDDSVSLKVDKTDYDNNNKVVDQKFTEFQQSVEEFNFKVNQLGNENIIKNAWFLGGLTHWGAVKWNNNDLSNMNFTIDSVVGNERDGWIPLGVSFARILNTGAAGNRHYGGIEQDMPVEPGETYTLSYYIAGHRINRNVIEIKRGDGSSSKLYTHVVTDIKKSKETGSQLDKDFTFVKYTFKVPSDCSKIMVFMWAEGRQNDSTSTNSVAWIAKTQLEKCEFETPRRLAPNEISNNTTTIDTIGVKVKSSKEAQFARMDNQFFSVYNGGEAPANRQAFMGLEDDVPTILLGAHGINPGVSTFGGTHLGFKHYSPAKSPLHWGGSWGMFEYKLDSGASHISRLGFSQTGSIELIPHNDTHIYKNLQVHGNLDKTGEISASMGLFQTYIRDWNITSPLRGIKVYSHVIGSDNDNNIYCVNKSGEFSKVHGQFINMQSARSAYSANISLARVFRDEARVPVDLGEFAEGLALTQKITLERQEEQEEAIICNLLASVEMYEMILEINPGVVNNEKRKSRMSDIYTTLINKNKISIDDVPLNIVDTVKSKL